MSVAVPARRSARVRTPVVRPVVTYKSQQQDLAKRLNGMAKMYDERGARELAASARSEARAALAALEPVSQEALNREIAGLRALDAKHEDMLKHRPKAWDALPDNYEDEEG